MCTYYKYYNNNNAFHECFDGIKRDTYIIMSIAASCDKIGGDRIRITIVNNYYNIMIHKYIIR